MPQRPVDAVIFDLDGLLFDSEQYWERSRREYARSRNCQWTPQDELGAKGLNSSEWAELIKSRCRLDLSLPEIVDRVVQHMRALYDEHLPVLPGAISTVETLAQAYPLGVASSSPPQLIEYALEKAGIRRYFTVVVSSDEVGRGKPSPDVFLVTAQRLRADPSRIVVFEDSSAGIRAGRAAGMRVIAVPNRIYPPSEEALAEADEVLPSLVEFRPELLASLTQGADPP